MALSIFELSVSIQHQYLLSRITVISYVTTIERISKLSK